MSPDQPDEGKRHWRDGVGSGDPPPRDGRTARAHRTRQAVADALLSLIEEGELRPTSKCIAARAGVSERTIFQHFEDLETLFSVAADRIGEGIVRNLGTVSEEGPLEDRITRYLDELLFLHESMTPIRRASRLHEPFSPVVASALGTWRENLRRGIERVFAPELRRWADESSRRDAVEAIALVVTWSSWDNMRRNSGFSCQDARRIMRIGIRGILSSAQSTGDEAASADA